MNEQRETYKVYYIEQVWTMNEYGKENNKIEPKPEICYYFFGRNTKRPLRSPYVEKYFSTYNRAKNAIPKIEEYVKIASTPYFQSIYDITYEVKEQEFYKK